LGKSSVADMRQTLAILVGPSPTSTQRLKVRPKGRLHVVGEKADCFVISRRTPTYLTNRRKQDHFSSVTAT
jgi:hypothetical protein